MQPRFLPVRHTGGCPGGRIPPGPPQTARACRPGPAVRPTFLFSTDRSARDRSIPDCPSHAGSAGTAQLRTPGRGFAPPTPSVLIFSCFLPYCFRFSGAVFVVDCVHMGKRCHFDGRASARPERNPVSEAEQQYRRCMFCSAKGTQWHRPGGKG